MTPDRIPFIDDVILDRMIGGLSRFHPASDECGKIPADAMLKILTSQQMRAVDRTTIDEIGIPGPVLMENAGLRIAEEILKRFPIPALERIVVVAGKGNNGGDGLVAARHLRQRGGKPVVLLLAAKDEVKGDAALNLAAAEKSGVEVVDASTELCWKKQRMTLIHASVVVDAIFGTGLDKPASGRFAAAIEDINKARGFKVAVDIPSGLSSDGFALIGPAVKANLTVALAAPKIGHIFPPASDLAGEIVVVDIGIPKYLFASSDLKLSLTEPGRRTAGIRPAKPGRPQGDVRPSHRVGRIGRQDGRRASGGQSGSAHGRGPGHDRHGEARRCHGRPRDDGADDRALARDGVRGDFHRGAPGH